MKKIAIIRKNGIGDFIAGCVPLCNYLIERYGDVEFHFFMTERNAAVARLFFPKAYVHVFSGGNKYFSHWKMAQKCKYLNFDIGISPVPNYPKLNNLFLLLLRAKVRYGNISGYLSKKCINTPSFEQSEHLTKEHVGLLSLQLLDRVFRTIPLQYYPVVKQDAIGKFDVQVCSPRIMVEVSNARIKSQFTAGKLIEIFNSLAKTHQFSVLITGVSKDIDKAYLIAKQLDVSKEVHVKLEFDDYVSYVNSADIVLCGDGGLGHLAAALGKKTIVCYGRTPLQRWQALGKNVECFYDPDNVNNIDSEKIEQQLKEFLS